MKKWLSESDPQEGQEGAINKQKASDQTSSHESHRIGACYSAESSVCSYSTYAHTRVSACTAIMKRSFSLCVPGFFRANRLFLLAAHMSGALTWSSGRLNVLSLCLRLKRIKSPHSGVHISGNNWLFSVNCCMGGWVKPDTLPVCLSSETSLSRWAEAVMIKEEGQRETEGWRWEDAMLCAGPVTTALIHP